MFTTRPDDALKFCRRIGIESELISTRTVKQRASVFFDQQLHPVPQGFSLMAANKVWPVLTSGLLTAKGKTELIREISKRPGPPVQDESLKSFAIRRYGPEIFERLIQPLVSGIYSADPDQLSLQATLPRFLEMEREYGSLSKASANVSSQVEKSASGARYDLFRAPQRGMQSMIDAAIQQLSNTKRYTNRAVEGVSRSSGKWIIHCTGYNDLTVDGVIVATPSRVASKLIGTVDQAMGAKLNKISFASLVVVVVGISKSDFLHEFDGFGVIQPSRPGQPFVACSLASNKFPGRANDDHMLLRCFFGGTMNPEVRDCSDEQLIDLTRSKLHSIFGFSGPLALTRVIRWNDCSPQYNLGHVDLVRSIFAGAAVMPGIDLAGSSYHGVGIPHCIRSGQAAASRLVRELRIA